MTLKNTTENIVKDLEFLVAEYHRCCCRGKEELSCTVDTVRTTKSFEINTEESMGAAIVRDLLHYCDIFSLGYYFIVRDNKLQLRIYWNE